MRGYATDVSLDANGRFVISTEMIKLSKISDDAVVLGQGNKKLKFGIRNGGARKEINGWKILLVLIEKTTLTF